MASCIWKWLFFAARNKIPKDQSLTITKNGTTTAPAGTRYTPITVNVPIPAEKKIQSTKSVTVSENGSSEIAPDTGYDGIAKVNLTTSVPVPTVQASKAVTLTENGTTSVTPDSGFDVLQKVEVTVNVGSVPVTVTIQNNNPYEDLQVYLAGETPTLLLTVSAGTSATHTFEQYTPYFFCYREAGTTNPDALSVQEIVTGWEISKNVFLCSFDVTGDSSLVRSSYSWYDFHQHTNGDRNFVTAMFCDTNATETIVIPNPAG